MPYTKETTKRRSGSIMGEAENTEAGKPRSAKVKEDNGVSYNFTGLPEPGDNVFTSGVGQLDRYRKNAEATAEYAERTNRNEMYTHILTDDEAIFAEPAELDPEATRHKLERNGILLKTTLGKQDNYASARDLTLRPITGRYNVVL